MSDSAPLVNVQSDSPETKHRCIHASKEYSLIMYTMIIQKQKKY